MTETSPVSTQTRADDSLDRRVSTVGRVGPHLEVKVIDPATGLTVPRGTPGELCTRGYSVMRGYWRQPDKTAEAVDAARWMHTGDLAVMDDDGYLAITGRIKDMVIRGGENVYPREIEEFLYTHPDILDAQVIGVPDAKYGEELMAWIRLRPGAPELTAEDLRAFCSGRLAHYKIPRYVHIVSEFPMTVTGKVRKVEMRERSIEILGLLPPTDILDLLPTTESRACYLATETRACYRRPTSWTCYRRPLRAWSARPTTGSTLPTIRHTTLSNPSLGPRRYDVDATAMQLELHERGIHALYPTAPEAAIPTGV
jgi:hypothetical protein